MPDDENHARFVISLASREFGGMIDVDGAVLAMPDCSW
jgi:hypothetical protein